jgi:hypothetical protein
VDGFLLYFACGKSLLKCPAIISQHVGNPLALVALFFHGANAMVKSRSVLIAHGHEIFWEEVLSESVRDAPLKTYYTPIAL